GMLRRVQAEQSALLDHHQIGLGTIQHDLGLGPLFDTLYVMRNTPADDEAFDALAAAVGLLDIDGGDATHYPATFIVHPGPSTRLILSHRSDLVDADTAEDWLQRAVRLLTAMTRDPEQAVGALQVHGGRILEKLVGSWAGHAEPIADGSLVARLAEAARRFPDRTALVGVRPGDLVTIELPRGCDVVTSLFAVLAVGAAYVPIDLTQPPARVAELRAASGARVFLTPELLAGETRPGPAGTCVGIDAGDLHPGYRHDDLAYAMFTSGSAGRPKAVAIEHAGLVNMLQNHRRRIFAPAGADAAEPWRVAHTVSFAFDMSWEELLWLLDGHEVHLLGEEVRRDPALLIDYLVRERVDVINVTPSVAGALLAGGLLDPAGHPPRLVLLGGEAVGPEVWSALRDAEHTHGYNLYGPTEYTINTLGGGTQESPTPIVGRAIDNTDVRVLDSALHPVADGVPGELYVTGAGLARGYHAAPRLTAERFVADPYGTPGARMYRTGDVVSRRPNGSFDFHGRRDAQVKIRGQRVEPGEVQGVLAADPRVARCAVVPRPVPSGALTLIGYVIPTPDPSATMPEDTWPEDARPEDARPEDAWPEDAWPALRDDLLRDLRASLPEVMVPAALVRVDDLPLTVNSKLDLAALPAPELERTGGRAPRGPREEAVCAVFAEVLGLDHVGSDDSFFALGGHSLLAMRAVALLAERLGRRVGVAALLSAPTPAALVEALDGRHDPFAELLPLGGRPGGMPLFCLSPVLGLGWTFASLAARLPGSPPVHAVQSPALTRAGHERPATWDALARHTADLIVGTADLAATGLRLLGWSFGAHLAHRVAAELEGRGLAVADITLLDPGPPIRPAEPGAVVGDPADDEQTTLGFLLSASLREVPSDLTRPYDRAEVLDFLAEGTGAWAGLTGADLDRLVAGQAYGAGLLLTADYRPVRAPVVLIASTVAPGGGQAPDPLRDVAEWARWCAEPPRLYTVDIPHLHLTAPYASDLLARLIATPAGEPR
ncbi:MAG TPA: amino acid adenylation domain-containing protein, partial [Candidatus Nanopelagicales bacterium]|nr:amino acid adenylation domain-containing protein [Candidatus Nanopelagicales bacterium]